VGWEKRRKSRERLAMIKGEGKGKRANPGAPALSGEKHCHGRGGGEKKRPTLRGEGYRSLIPTRKGEGEQGSRHRK